MKVLTLTSIYCMLLSLSLEKQKDLFLRTRKYHTFYVRENCIKTDLLIAALLESTLSLLHKLEKALNLTGSLYLLCAQSSVADFKEG